MKPHSRVPAIQSFEALNVLSLAATVAIAVSVAVYCRFTPAKNFYWTTRHMMQYLGLIHFAVGYHFFFASPAARSQITGSPVSFFAKLLGCLLVSVSVYQFPVLEPIVYTLFYLHAAENAVYHIYRIGQAPSAPADERVSSDALFPMLCVLILGRLSPLYATHVETPVRLVCLVTLLACILFLQTLLPVTSWRQGWRLLVRHHTLLAYFLVVSLFFREGLLLYDYFIIWHYVIWFIYTWVQKPSDRTRLVLSHAAFAVIYKGLYLLGDARIVLFHPLVLSILVGPVSFMAQTTCHILLAFVFRQYPAAARAQGAGTLRVAPAV